MDDAKDCVEKMVESQPGYVEPTAENVINKQAEQMHEDFEKLQKEFKQMEEEKKIEKEKVDKAKVDAAKKEKE